MVLAQFRKEEKHIFHILSAITPKIKDKILKFKYLLNKENISKHKITSSNIYEAVIDKDIRNFEIFLGTFF